MRLGPDHTIAFDESAACEVAEVFRLRAKLHLDADARFMVTDEEAADRVTDALTRLAGVSPHTVVFDGTACIGGNTLSHLVVQQWRGTG